MSDIKLVLVEDASGDVRGECLADENAQPVAPNGHTYRVGVEGVSYMHKHWDGEAFVDEAAPPVVVTRSDFARLFTQGERIAIRDAQDANDQTGKVIRDFYALLELAGEVQLDHVDVGMGLAFLVSLELLAPERAAAIAANTPPA